MEGFEIKTPQIRRPSCSKSNGYSCRGRSRDALKKAQQEASEIVTRRLTPYLFIGGAAVYLVLMTAAPLLNGLWLSLTDATLLNPTAGEFVGPETTVRCSASPGSTVAVDTVAYSAATVACSLLIGTFAAVMLNRAFRGRAVARAVLTLPWAVPTVAVGLIFTWIYNNESGVLNRAPARSAWAAGLADRPDWAMAAVPRQACGR